jgi:3-oxoacid CoA-transferase subunit A
MPYGHQIGPRHPRLVSDNAGAHVLPRGRERHERHASVVCPTLLSADRVAPGSERVHADLDDRVVSKTWRFVRRHGTKDTKARMDKTVSSADDAVADVHDGTVLMAGGFGLCGIPENLIAALHRRGTRDLSIISNNCGIDGKGLGVLLQNGQVKKITASYVGENKTFERLFLEGKLDVELCPQGTLAERIRAGGAGIPAFFTPSGYGTAVAAGKEIRVFDGRNYILETALRADFAFVKAWKGDRFGNLVYRKTTRNFNPMMASAARITIAEVEELVEPGVLDPDQIHTPGIYVKRIVLGASYEKPIEQRTTRKRKAGG